MPLTLNLQASSKKPGAPVTVFASTNNKSNQNNWLSIQFVLWKRQHPGRITQSPQRLCMNKTALLCISGGAQHCKAVREAVSVQPALTGLWRLRSPALSTCALENGEKKEKNYGNTAENRTDTSLPAAVGRRIRLHITSVVALQARCVSFIQKPTSALGPAGT